MSKRRPRLATTTRFEVLRRDGYKCQYCGAEPSDRELVVDHIVPLDQGGTDDPANLTTSCAVCNRGKSDKSLDDAEVSRLAASAKVAAARTSDMLRASAPKQRRMKAAGITSSVERYREKIWTLVEEVEAGPDFDRYGADPKLAMAIYHTRLDLLNAISKAALADKGLEDLAAIHTKLRQAEATIADMMRASADERHNRSTRVEAGCAAGDGVTGPAIH